MFHCSIPQRRHWFDDEMEVLTATNVVPQRRPLMVQKLKSCGLAVVNRPGKESDAVSDFKFIHSRCAP